MNHSTEVTADDRGHPTPRRNEGEVMALVITWTRDAPERVGEVLLVPASDDESLILGRAGGSTTPPLRGTRASFIRQRPGHNATTGELASRRISRTQLRISALDEQRLAIDNIGRRAMEVNGAPTQHAVVLVGDVVALVDELVLVCVSRPVVMPPAGNGAAPDHAFGRADALGLVGESPASWRLREATRFVGDHGGHVLVSGGPGSGKTFVAKAIHAVSDRRARPIVIRQIATIPRDLLGAEIFGHAAGYAGLGTEDRVGLAGGAAGSTLVLDDLCDADEGAIEHFHGLMDDGRYCRLGEVESRHADLRVVVTCEGAPETLPAPLVRRCRHTVRVPSLAERRDDVPLLARHLLATGLAEHPDLAARFLDPAGEPRLSQRLVVGLVRHDFTSGIRELEALLWQCIVGSTGLEIEPCPALEPRMRPAAPVQRRALAVPSPERPLPEGLPESVRRGLAELSKTELIVLQHLALNKTSRQIARSLFLSVRTVQNHRARICERLGLRGNNRLLGIALALADYLGAPPADG